MSTAPSAHTGNQHLYRRHRPEETALYPVIEAHLPTFMARLHARDTQLPRFVTDEFNDYLRCGRLEHGFVRVKCEGCRHEHLVAFSCKCRGFCPSCGAPRRSRGWRDCGVCSRSICPYARIAADDRGSLLGAAYGCHRSARDPAQTCGRHTAHLARQQGPPAAQSQAA